LWTCDIETQFQNNQGYTEQRVADDRNLNVAPHLTNAEANWLIYHGQRPLSDHEKRSGRSDWSSRALTGTLDSGS